MECAPDVTETTRIPNEIVSPLPVKIVREIFIPDVMEAILEQERMGALEIRRYGQLSSRALDWIFQAELEEVRKRDLLRKPGPMADYIKTYYPAVWERACAEMKKMPEV